VHGGKECADGKSTRGCVMAMPFFLCKPTVKAVFKLPLRWAVVLLWPSE
jgi:hypothetical protein